MSKRVGSFGFWVHIVLLVSQHLYDVGMIVRSQLALGSVVIFPIFFLYEDFYDPRERAGQSFLNVLVFIFPSGAYTLINITRLAFEGSESILGMESQLSHIILSYLSSDESQLILIYSSFARQQGTWDDSNRLEQMQTNPSPEQVAPNSSPKQTPQHQLQKTNSLQLCAKPRFS